MDRREFLKNAALLAGSRLIPETTRDFKTRHVIWIINGNGSRKKDWYQNPALSPNFDRLAKEGFVFEESHNDTVTNHARCWLELITGHPHASDRLMYPTPLHYLRKAHSDAATNYWLVSGVRAYRQWQLPDRAFGEDTNPVWLTIADPYATPLSPRVDEFIRAFVPHRPPAHDPFESDAAGLALIPSILKEFRPKMILCHVSGHDAGHGNDGCPCPEAGYFQYRRVCRTTDEQLGRILDFVKGDAYFSKRTAIVVRPEFGRDDEVNALGELHHSEGYYQTMRSAEIWWGPDFRVGVDKSLKNRVDFVPSITSLFNVNATFASGRPHTEMFQGKAVTL